MKWNRRKRKNQTGFTLTELMVVVAVIALIGGIVVTNVISRYNTAKVDVTKTQIRQLGVNLDLFKLDCGFYPTTEQGLEALISKPTGRDCKNYNVDGYIKGKVPKDGFGHDFVYLSEGRDYEIRSLGNDNQEGGDDIDADISSSEIE